MIGEDDPFIGFSPDKTFERRGQERSEISASAVEYDWRLSPRFDANLFDTSHAAVRIVVSQKGKRKTGDDMPSHFHRANKEMLKLLEHARSPILKKDMR